MNTSSSSKEMSSPADKEQRNDGSSSRFGRKRKLPNLNEYVVYGRHGNLTDFNNQGSLTTSTTSKPSKPELNNKVPPVTSAMSMSIIENATSPPSCMLPDCEMIPDPNTESTSEVVVSVTSDTSESAIAPTAATGASPSTEDPSLPEMAENCFEDVFEMAENCFEDVFDENIPLEQQRFVDTELWRADAPPELKTYKRKMQSPLRPVATINTLTQQTNALKQESRGDMKEDVITKPLIKLPPEPQQQGKPSILTVQPQETQDLHNLIETGGEDPPQTTNAVCGKIDNNEPMPKSSLLQQERETGEAQEQGTEDDILEHRQSVVQVQMVCHLQHSEGHPCAGSGSRNAKEHVHPLKFEVGDLIWARMSSGAPYWPALLTRDEQTSQFFRNAPGTGPRASASLHVTFYGAKNINCAAWVTIKNLLPFQGSTSLDYSHTIFKHNIGTKSSKILVCKCKPALAMADEAASVSKFQRVLSIGSMIDSLRCLQTEKKATVMARRAQRATQEADTDAARMSDVAQEQEVDDDTRPDNTAQSNDDEEETGQAKQGGSSKLERKGRGREKPRYVQTSATKRLRLSTLSPNRTDPEPKTEVNKKPTQTKKHPRNTLTINMEFSKRRLRNAPSTKVCEQCFKQGRVLSCSKCHCVAHRHCDNTEKDPFVCQRCRVEKPCDLCNRKGHTDSDLLSCTEKKCSKKYHSECLKQGWFQAKHSYNKNLICPYHTCHTCVSDDPSSQRLFVKADQLVCCIYCPTAYHASDVCIPAATRVLSTSQCICPKHPSALPKRDHLPAYTTNWCFACTKGGELAMCDTCPTVYHPECVERVSAEVASNQCAECETGSFPICGQIVWAKHGNFRWWPARIAFQEEVEQLYAPDVHNHYEFVVQFLGTNDLAWTNNKRVFPYIQEDHKSEQRKKLTSGHLDKKFELGLKEADRLFSLYKSARNAAKAELQLEPPSFQYVTANKIISTGIKARMQEIIETEGSDKCNCAPEGQNPCGFGTGCLNRDLSVECGTDCPAGDLCQNRLFTKGKYATVQPVLTSQCGWGLVTLENLKEGDFVMEYTGDLIDVKELQVRMDMMKKHHDKNFYFLAVEPQLYIDAGPRGNESRFINHSCEPNCKADKWIVGNELRMGLFAIQDIPENSELTFDYNLKILDDKTQPCFCGTSSCSGFIGNKGKAGKGKHIATVATTSKAGKAAFKSSVKSSTKSNVTKSTNPSLQSTKPSLKVGPKNRKSFTAKSAKHRKP